VRFLLDTVAFIRAAKSPELLSRRAVSLLRGESSLPELSSISLSELAIKQGKGKLNFQKAGALEIVAELKIRILPYTVDHARVLFDLPWHHSDPFDRQIIAQAVSEGIPVITSDEKFKLYKELTVIW
jgi:PIN domain nuclease of toxin-antitoxin system